MKASAPSRLHRATLMRARRRDRSRQWADAHREPLQRALAQIQAEAIVLHFLRWLLIHPF